MQQRIHKKITIAKISWFVQLAIIVVSIAISYLLFGRCDQPRDCPEPEPCPPDTVFVPVFVHDTLYIELPPSRFDTTATFEFAWGKRDLLVWWDRNRESDLSGYKVYFGDRSGEYDLNIDVGTDTSLKRVIPGFRNRMYVAVTAYDLSGNESNFSEEVSFGFDNNIPPAFSDTLFPGDSRVIFSGDVIVEQRDWWAVTLGIDSTRVLPGPDGISRIWRVRGNKVGTFKIPTSNIVVLRILDDGNGDELLNFITDGRLESSWILNQNDNKVHDLTFENVQEIEGRTPSLTSLRMNYILVKN